MNLALSIVLLSVCAADAKPVPDEENSCIQCHANLTEKDQTRFLVKAEQFAEDVHWGKGLRCQHCHGGDPTVFEIKAHQATGDFRAPASRAESPKLCDSCHPVDQHTWGESAHGHGLQHAGLTVTAVCADCHGAHGVYRAAHGRSLLHPDRVGATCGKCHGLISERLQKSIHARNEHGPGGPRSAAATADRMPTCIDCHQGHDQPQSATAGARLASPNRCGGCHAKLSTGYALSVHGSLTTLGYRPSATCSDCHGAHDVLAVANPGSTLADGRRRETCGKCHADATAAFLDFDPHADHRDPDRDPVLHGVYLVLMTLLLTTFGCFGLHSLLWFVRGLIDVFRHGRTRSLPAGAVAYTRFGPFHRVAHTVMVLSFLGLAVTGLPLKYSGLAWAGALADAFGGFESTHVAHRIFGVVNIGCLVVYAARMLAQLAAGPRRGGTRLGMIFGPDSPVPTLRDVKDAFKMVRWFCGLGPKPTFERWTYWEKFDFWGACADIVIIGGTGLILWFPHLACAYLPGKALNLAKVVHSTQALLATGFVFAIHFFNTHLRPEKFPMDMCMLTGRVSEEDLREERPAYLERMRREGRLEGLQTRVPAQELLWLSRLGGTVALFAGLGLLAGLVAAGLSG
jgi:cytochrome b subunit of formate dehydrogenase